MGGEAGRVRRGPKLVATLVAVALVAVLTALDQTVVATALPHMIAELQGAPLLGWVFTAYFVAATATVAVAGKLADLFGRRTVFATASAVGPSVGGILSDGLSWRWIFLINVPLCLITLAVVWYGLQASSRRRPRVQIDWPGATWSMLGMVAVLLALTWGGREVAWWSPTMGGLLATAVVAGLLLWWTERRAADPFVPAGILRGPVVPFACVALFATFFVWFTMILLAPLRLQLVLGTSATAAGALLTPGIVLSPICAFTAGQVLSRTGRYRLTARGGAVAQLIGLAMLLVVPSASADLWVLASFAIVGMGTGFTAPSLMIGFQNAIAHRQLGAAIGLLSLFRQLGASVGTALIGAIVGASVAEVTTTGTASAINEAVLVQLVAGVVVLVGVWLIADVPLGTARTGETAEGLRRGRAWSRAIVDH
jgi:MFS family permease